MAIRKKVIKMGIKNCTVCGCEFESHYGKEVCSDKCFLERKQLHDAIGNKRRYSGTAKEPISKTCPWCGNNFEGLNRRYCSPECSESARKQRRKELFDEYYSNPEKRRHHIDLTTERNKKNRNKE
jgi:predicted nucleic acid-binding Zn ribbon protein